MHFVRHIVSNRPHTRKYRWTFFTVEGPNPLTAPRPADYYTVGEVPPCDGSEPHCAAVRSIRFRNQRIIIRATVSTKSCTRMQP